MKINVVQGDITQIHADALITAINSGGLWYGGIDGAIQRSSGNLFHSQAEKALPLKHGDTVVAKANGTKHHGDFSNVVFVIDDLEGPLYDVILQGLAAASLAGFKSVTLPTIRMGVMRGAVEKTVDEALRQTVMGVETYIDNNPRTEIENITFVVYNNPRTAAALQQKLAALNN